MNIFIIVSTENERSVQKAKECIESANKFGIYPQIFEAIKGTKSNKTFNKLKIKLKPINENAACKLNSSGVRGCLASHLELLNMCSRSNVPYLILEHDAYFIRKIDFNNLMTKFKNVLHLDACSHTDIDYDLQINYSLENEINVIDYNTNCKKRKIGNDERIHTRFCGSHAYIIKPHASERIINYVRTCGLMPADWLFNKYIFNKLHGVSASVVCINPNYNTLEEKKKNLSLTSC